MNLTVLKPHLIAIAGFIVLAGIFFYPVLQGKKLVQHDVIQAHAMGKEVIDYNEETGDYAFWTNRMFGGMPIIQIYLGSKTNILKYPWIAFKNTFPRPMEATLIYLLGFYILMTCLGFKPLWAFFGSIAYCFASYNIIILEAGHLSKAMALGYAPAILGGIYLITKKQYARGLLIAALATGFQIMSNHIQITYYLLLVIVIWMLFELVNAFKSKGLPLFGKSVAFMIAAAIVGALVNTTPIITTRDYVEETIRGEQELVEKKTDGNGLDKGYALSWSYGKMETMTLLIPNFMGGASGAGLDENSATFEELRGRGVGKKQALNFVQSLPLYWGAQPFTSGPVYFGAIVLLLALLGLFISDDRAKWWLLASTLFCIFISWGKNLDWFYSIFFDYFPLFNKFRAPSMILGVANIMVVWLAMLGLKAVLDKKKEDLKKVLQVGGGLAALCLVFALMGSAFIDFDSQSVKNGVSADEQFEQQMVQMTKSQDFGSAIMSGILEDRAGMMQSDALRSFFLIALALGLIYWYMSKSKLKPFHVVAALTVITLFDLWTVDKRYLHEDKYQKVKEMADFFSLTPAESRMMTDQDPHYRVLNTTVNIFNDAKPSYFYNTIGGYHAAKLKRYQDLIERQISPEIQKLNQGFDATPVLNMLNMKYVIFGKDENSVALNDKRMGNAWFVEEIQEVNSANEEIDALNGFNPAKTAIVDKRFESYYQNWKSQSKGSSNGSISLTHYEPDVLKYSFNSSQDELVVFSEVYYHGNKDWIAYIDGEPADHFRANYVLRSMVVPAGEHEIEFRFVPKAFVLGERVSMAGSILLLLVIGGYVYMTFIRKNGDAKPEVPAAE